MSRYPFLWLENLLWGGGGYKTVNYSVQFSGHIDTSVRNEFGLYFHTFVLLYYLFLCMSYSPELIVYLFCVLSCAERFTLQETAPIFRPVWSLQLYCTCSDIFFFFLIAIPAHTKTHTQTHEYNQTLEWKESPSSVYTWGRFTYVPVVLSVSLTHTYTQIQIHTYKS